MKSSILTQYDQKKLLQKKFIICLAKETLLVDHDMESDGRIFHKNFIFSWDSVREQTFRINPEGLKI